MMQVKFQEIEQCTETVRHECHKVYKTVLEPKRVHIEFTYYVGWLT